MHAKLRTFERKSFLFSYTVNITLYYFRTNVFTVQCQKLLNQDCFQRINEVEGKQERFSFKSAKLCVHNKPSQGCGLILPPPIRIWVNNNLDTGWHKIRTETTCNKILIKFQKKYRAARNNDNMIIISIN